jgi:hypothetical protein
MKAKISHYQKEMTSFVIQKDKIKSFVITHLLDSSTNLAN